MTSPTVRIALAAAACLLARPLGMAEDQTPAAKIATIALNDGRVLHNVKVMSNEGASLVVHADEGLLKIARTNLPPAMAAAYPAKGVASTGAETVMPAFNPDKPPEDPPTRKPEPKDRPMTPRPVARARPVFKGCTIVSFQMKAFQGSQGSEQVVVQNNTEADVELEPADFNCILTDGTRHAAGYIVTDGYPFVIKKKEIVPARGQIDDLIVFANKPLDIASVEWRR
ncbi:MAG TPA: hypothetical protein VII09_00085 [Opitutaceae bacterium]